MITEITNTYRTRVDFGKIKSILAPPPLVDVQKQAYESFIQRSVAPKNRKKRGLEAIFHNVFPIEDFDKKFRIEYISYKLGEPKYDQEDCRGRGTTYAVPIYAKLKLVIFESNSLQSEDNKQKKIKDIKEQEIFFGDFPLMTPTGCFIVNGTERVVVNQLHKSPGVFFLEAAKKPGDAGIHRNLFVASIIPQRGSWVDFEFDSKDTLLVRVDRKKKFSASVFLKALGYTTEQLLEKFYTVETFTINTDDKNQISFYKQFNADAYENKKLEGDLIQAQPRKILKKKGEKLGAKTIQNYKENSSGKYIVVSKEEILGRVSACDLHDKEENLILRASHPLTENQLEKLLEEKINKIKLLKTTGDDIDASLCNTFALDDIETQDEAVVEVYKKLESGIPSLEKSRIFVEKFLFSKEVYDLSAVGRMQFNQKFGLKDPLSKTVLDHDDIFRTVKKLFSFKKGRLMGDDIDDLNNRRIRNAGELLSQCFNKGMFRVEKNIKEKLILLEDDNVTLHDLVNSKLVIATVHDFFATSQLSQFMDQTNPLSEITHKRRLSALGPGGLSRERAGFEVRDVHPSHYGKICPIETPEGPSIGLMSSLTSYARLNEFGFIETPYRKIVNHQLTNEISYMSAIEDKNYYIAQSNALLDKKEKFIKEIIVLRKNSEFKSLPREWAQYIDLSPRQLVSIAASLIPFLEHDDANRALMGSNMQRQSVPLAIAEAPFVGTGMEHMVAKDSGVCVVAEKDGIVDSVDSQKIVVESNAEENNPFGVKIYKLKKYHRSNQSTCINQVSLVKQGEKIKKGQIIADGPCCESGELALGKNVFVAFMPWNGYNYEDSIVVSEKLLHRDTFTSIHIEKFDAFARDTKIGRENITRDVPNTSEHSLRHLDESGIVRIGSYVKSGDTLVGKSTPKIESQLNPEEKLLRAVFGDKAGDIRDTSLRVPQGVSGIVIDVKSFIRRGTEKDVRTLEIEELLVKNTDEDYKNEVRILKTNFLKRNASFFKNQILKYDLVNVKNHEVLLKKGDTPTLEELLKLPINSLAEIHFADSTKNTQFKKLFKEVKDQLFLIETIYRELIEKKRKLEDLPQGVNRIIKVYIAMKRKLAVGDKMSGRHGNKGVISKILPVEDMPYTEEGEPIDIVLNPLSVPSRMNIGQILETHLGFISKKLGNQVDKMLKEMSPYKKIKDFVKKIYQSDFINNYLEKINDADLLEFFTKLSKGVHFATPVFDGAKEEEIRRLMDLCGIDYSGKVTLYDGRTGNKLKQKVTIGYKYICKLYHLVDDKLHARSTGPYSLVTQQPLGGKAQFGGQRFGEMEVWALEAYGASFILRELLTVKSDDTYGRNKAYEAIVKGNLYYKTGIPESFRVLINEIRSLCIDLELIEDDSIIGNTDDGFADQGNNAISDNINDDNSNAVIEKKEKEVIA